MCPKLRRNMNKAYLEVLAWIQITLKISRALNFKILKFRLQPGLESKLYV